MNEKTTISSAPVTAQSHLVLVDGSAYIFRAFHALPPLTRKTDGLPIGAVAGFSNMLFKLLQNQTDSDRPTHFAVIFDASGHTFRNEIYPDYKANRGETPEELIPQFPLTRDATRAFGAASVEMKGYEADDLIATYARQAESKGARVTIISSDKDLMQLVSDKVIMRDPMKNRDIGVAEVIEKFGVEPERVIDVQALAGDSIDNIPGVPGIGVKTAALLLNEYGPLEVLLERSGEIPQKGRREKMLAHQDMARLSKELVTLKTDIELEVPLEDLTVSDPDIDQLFDFLDAMTFRTLAGRVRTALGEEGAGLRKADSGAAFEETASGAAHFDTAKYVCVQDEAVLRDWVARAMKTAAVAVDLETDSLDSAAANLVGVCLAIGDNDACYIPLGHKGESGGEVGESADMFATEASVSNTPKQIDMARALEILEPLLHAPGVLKVGQNFKYDLGVFARHGLYPAPYDDTMLISYALSAGLHRHGMDALSELYLDHSPISFKEIAGTGKNQKTFDQIDLEVATKYAAEDADVTLRLWRILKPKLAAAQCASVYETMDRPLPRVIAAMENHGIKVDPLALSQLSSTFAQKMAALEDEAHQLAETAFNLGSPKQIGEILFDQMELSGGKKTKTGAWQTGVEVLEKLADGGEVLPRLILDWRHYSKLKSTYTDALVAQINPDTKRVHTSFSLASTTTGRFSSSDPNLQNIPIRTEDGRKIRDAFIAETGHLLVAADYSQIELRLLAHVADLPTMKQAFSDGVDIHALTASEIFGVPLSEMSAEVRRKAKAINFGIIYGISAFGLAKNIGIGRGEAGDYIETYFKKFPGIRTYMEAAKAQAHELGYVQTIFGRKCHINGIKDRNAMRRGFAERQAINAPIQGAAADIMRRAMIQMPEALAPIDGAKMLLQVHDELVFEVPSAKSDSLIEIVQNVMQNAHHPAIEISVPLLVEAQAAKNWNDAH